MTQLLVRFWWLLVIGAVAAGTLGYVVVSQQPPTYEARVRLLVGDLSGDFDGIRASEALATTYAELAVSDIVLERAVGSLEPRLPVEAIDDAVSAVTVGTSRILLITVEMSDAEQAPQVANALARALVAFRNPPPGQLTILDPAEGSDPVPKRLPALVGLAAIGGAALVAAMLLMLDRSEDLLPRRRDR